MASVIKAENRSDTIPYLVKREKVSVEMGVRYAGKTPYIVIYTFNHQGKVYHRESCFLWDKPDVMASDSIVVYINDSGKSTIQL